MLLEWFVSGAYLVSIHKWNHLSQSPLIFSSTALHFESYSGPSPGFSSRGAKNHCPPPLATTLILLLLLKLWRDNNWSGVYFQTQVLGNCCPTGDKLVDNTCELSFIIGRLLPATSYEISVSGCTSKGVGDKATINAQTDELGKFRIPGSHYLPPMSLCCYALQRSMEFLIANTHGTATQRRNGKYGDHLLG